MSSSNIQVSALWISRLALLAETEVAWLQMGYLDLGSNSLNGTLPSSWSSFVAKSNGLGFEVQQLQSPLELALYMSTSLLLKCMC